MTVDEIVGRVNQQHVVITGGEPMLFDGTELLTSRLRALGHTITIETAGTVYRDVACDLMSISPKLSHSTPPEETGWRDRHEASRLAIDVLQELTRQYVFQLKFVVAQLVDFEEIEVLLAKIGTIPGDRILVMPEGVDSAGLHASMKRLVEPVMRRGWRLCPRLHVDLFGNTRGT